MKKIKGLNHYVNGIKTNFTNKNSNNCTSTKITDVSTMRETTSGVEKLDLGK